MSLGELHLVSYIEMEKISAFVLWQWLQIKLLFRLNMPMTAMIWISSYLFKENCNSRTPFWIPHSHETLPQFHFSVQCSTLSHLLKVVYQKEEKKRHQGTSPSLRYVFKLFVSTKMELMSLWYFFFCFSSL